MARAIDREVADDAGDATALDAIIRIDLKGDGGNDGQELLSVLKITPQAA